MFWSPTGGGVRRYLLAKHAWWSGQPGWRHTIAVPGAAGSAFDVSTLPSLPLPGSGGYRLPLRRGAVARVLIDLAPTLIEAGDPYRVAWGALDAAQALGVPSVAYCHSNLLRMARLAGGRAFGAAAAASARRYMRHLYANFDLVLAPSRDMTRQLRDAGIGSAGCQPLGVDSTVFAPSRSDPSWRQRHGFDASTRVLVYVGRFAPEKHLDVLVDAVRRLGAPYVLVVVGAGPTPPAAHPRVRVLPFVAKVEELATVLASADAFVHAGDQETFGLSVLEAMACGTPAVVRHAAGLAELVESGAGVGVASGTGAAFAEAIEALFAGDSAALSRAARQRGVAGDWQRVLPALRGHYARLLGLDADGAASAGESSAASPGSVAAGEAVT